MLKTFCKVTAIAICLSLPFTGLGQTTDQEDDSRPKPLGDREGQTIVSRPGTDQVLTMRECVEQALQNNDLLHAERERLGELDGQVNQALSTGMPSLDLIGNFNRGRDPSFALDETFSGGELPEDSPFAGLLPTASAIPPQTFWRASADLLWTLNPKQVISAVGAANTGINRQNLIITGAQNRVAEEAITAYYDIILVVEAIAATEAQIANQQEFLDITRMRFQTGMAAVQDTLQAAVSVANLVPQLNRAKKELANAGSRLNRIMGRDPKGPISVRYETFVELDTIDRQRAIDLALLRPEVGEVEMFVDILQSQRKAQKAEMWPHLNMAGSFGFVGREITGMTDPGHQYWNASISLVVPLFDGMLTRGRTQETAAAIRRTESELSGLKRQVEVEVLDILNSLETARKNYEAARLNLLRSEDLQEQMSMMYSLGKTDYLNTLVSEATRSDARNNLIEAGYEVLTLTASLKRAIGYSPQVPLKSIDGLVTGDSQ